MKIKIPFFSRNTNVVCTTKQVVDIKKKKTLDDMLEDKDNAIAAAMAAATGASEAGITFNGIPINEISCNAIDIDFDKPILSLMSEWSSLLHAGLSVDTDAQESYAMIIQYMVVNGNKINYTIVPKSATKVEVTYNYFKWTVTFPVEITEVNGADAISLNANAWTSDPQLSGVSDRLMLPVFGYWRKFLTVANNTITDADTVQAIKGILQETWQLLGEA